MTHTGYDQAGGLTDHKGVLEDCPAPECMDQVAARYEEVEQEGAAALDATPCLASYREDPMPETVHCQEIGYHSRHRGYDSASGYYAWLDGDEGASYESRL